MPSATANVKGGLFSQYDTTLVQINSGRGTVRRRIAQSLDGDSMRPLRGLMKALDGVAPGAVATETKGRIEANSELGGKRVIESVALINRATTAGDVTEINASVLNTLTSRTTFGANPVANKDGNPLGTR